MPSSPLGSRTDAEYAAHGLAWALGGDGRERETRRHPGAYALRPVLVGVGTDGEGKCACVERGELEEEFAGVEVHSTESVEVLGEDDPGKQPGWSVNVVVGEERAVRVRRRALGGEEAGEEPAGRDGVTGGDENLSHEAVEERPDGDDVGGYEAAVELDRPLDGDREGAPHEEDAEDAGGTEDTAGRAARTFRLGAERGYGVGEG